MHNTSYLPPQDYPLSYTVDVHLFVGYSGPNRAQTDHHVKQLQTNLVEPRQIIPVSAPNCLGFNLSPASPPQHNKVDPEREFCIPMSRKFSWSKDVLIHRTENLSYEKTLLGQTSFRPRAIGGPRAIA